MTHPHSITDEVKDLVGGIHPVTVPLPSHRESSVPGEGSPKQLKAAVTAQRSHTTSR